MKEIIVLVDKTGKPIGEAEKLPTHNADTPLHLAFSCYVFNNKGEFLVTQRAHVKKVWPTVWTNSVCGHPAPHERMVDAIKRRLNYELGMQAKDFTEVIPDYVYKTPPYKGVVEHEYCPIYFARAISDPQPNAQEVDAYKWVPWQSFVSQAEADTADVWSWWCKDQLKLLKERPEIAQYKRPL